MSVPSFGLVGCRADRNSTRIPYTLSFIYFSLVQFYVLIDSFYLVANAFTGGMLDFNLNDGVLAFLQSFFSSSGGGIVLIALVSTYGIYVLASVLYADPWHIITSAWAYFLGMTTSINILMVYAFCNWHDVSWGTKGSDKAEALPSAQTKKDDDNKHNFIEEVDKPQADIDSQFESTVKRALAPFSEPEEEGGTSLDDSYRNFRTVLVLLWVFSNLILSLLITATGIDRLCLTVCLLSFFIFCPRSVLTQVGRTHRPTAQVGTSRSSCGRQPVCVSSDSSARCGSWRGRGFSRASTDGRGADCTYDEGKKKKEQETGMYHRIPDWITHAHSSFYEKISREACIYRCFIGLARETPTRSVHEVMNWHVI